MIERLDIIRQENPELGFALYAIEPGGPVTLEVYAPDGEVYPFSGRTAADAMAFAFPEPLPAPPQPPETIFD